jgi:hypothetical protein
VSIFIAEIGNRRLSEIKAPSTMIGLMNVKRQRKSALPYENNT